MLGRPRTEQMKCRPPGNDGPIPGRGGTNGAEGTLVRPDRGEVPRPGPVRKVGSRVKPLERKESGRTGVCGNGPVQCADAAQDCRRCCSSVPCRFGSLPVARI